MSAGVLVDYAPLPPWYRRPRARRITLGVFVGAILLLGVYYWPLIRAQGTRLYWEHRCLNHQAAAGTISYSNDPQDIPSLSGGGVASRPAWGTGPYAIRQIPELEKLFKRSLEPALFLHGRKAPSGPQRLVIVQMGRLPNDPYNRIFLSLTNHQPLWTSGTIPATPSGGLEMCLKSTDVVRLYHGQPDPNDGSAFTIDYDLNGTRGTIDGKLTSSGTITLTPRSGRVVLLGGNSFWSPGEAPLPPAVEEELARSSTTRPTR
jgi:hypothetical protein